MFCDQLGAREMAKPAVDIVGAGDRLHAGIGWHPLQVLQQAFACGLQNMRGIRGLGQASQLQDQHRHKDERGGSKAQRCSMATSSECNYIDEFLWWRFSPDRRWKRTVLYYYFHPERSVG